MNGMSEETGSHHRISRREAVITGMAAAAVGGTMALAGLPGAAADVMPNVAAAEGVDPMSTSSANDQAKIYFKDWGRGQPVVFSHGWPLSADAWDDQMMFLASHGFRAIAHDRRGHGRSDQTFDGNDLD